MKESVFQKIERNLGITLDDVNMTYYQKICLSLVEAGRYQSPIWNRLEHFVTRNLSMDYTAKTFFDIFKCFALTHNGSAEFYEVCQDVIHQGHLYKPFAMIRNNLGEYDSAGDYFALMIETYAIIQRRTPIDLTPDFLDYIYKSMTTSKIEYKDIASLTKIMKNMEAIGFYPQ